MNGRAASALHGLPSVSVIIPVRNDADRLAQCLSALGRGTYPSDLLEIIVVDNGSDRRVEPPQAPAMRTKVIVEPAVGSYAARNRGIAEARGEIIAFTDADCIPDGGWLLAGVRRLMAEPDVGLVAGRIEVLKSGSSRPSAAELLEAISAFPQEKYAHREHYGATANVLTRRTVLETVGAFDPTLESGGDREWGRRVHRAGFGVVYEPAAVVRHPARTLISDLVEKQRRLVRGTCQLIRKGHLTRREAIGYYVGSVLPPILDWLRLALRPGLSWVDKARIGGVLARLRFVRLSGVLAYHLRGRPQAALTAAMANRE